MNLNDQNVAKRVEREFCEAKLFFFSEIITGGDTAKDFLDGNYHWDGQNFYQDNKWCDNCKHFEQKPAVASEAQFRRFSGYCNYHKRRTACFDTCEEKGVKQIRKMSLEPRENLKSTLYTKNGSLWTLIKDINFTNVIISETEGISSTFLSWIISQCTYNEKLREYWPWVKIENKISASQFKLEFRRDNLAIHEPNIYAIGLDKSFQGGHYRRLTFDDLCGKTNTGSDTRRQSAYESYLATKPLEMKLFPQRFMAGTRWGAEDIPGREFSSEEGMKWDVRHEELFFKFNDKGMKIQVTVGDLENILKKNSIKEVIGDYYVPYKVGYPNEEKIIDAIKEGTKDWFFFMCQYFNRPKGHSSQALNPDWILRISRNELMRTMPLDLMNCYICWDMASGAKGQNVTAFGGVVWYYSCYEDAYLWRSMERRMTMNQFLDLFFEWDETYHPMFHTLEKGTILNMFEPILMREYKIRKEQYLKEAQSINNEEKRKEAMDRYERFSIPKIMPIPRGGQSTEKKKHRVVAQLQAAYEKNQFKTTPKLYHVGEAEEHKIYENEYENIEELTHYDVLDAAADGPKVWQKPNKQKVLAELEHRKTNKVMLDPENQRIWEGYKKMIDQFNQEEAKKTPILQLGSQDFYDNEEYWEE